MCVSRFPTFYVLMNSRKITAHCAQSSFLVKLVRTAHFYFLRELPLNICHERLSSPSGSDSAQRAIACARASVHDGHCGVGGSASALRSGVFHRVVPRAPWGGIQCQRKSCRTAALLSRLSILNSGIMPGSSG